jgi:hypothetical protein
MTGFFACFSVRYRSCSDCRSMPHLTGNSNCSFARSHLDRLAVIHMHEFRADDPLELRHQPLLDPLVEEGEIFPPLVQ